VRELKVTTQLCSVGTIELTSERRELLDSGNGDKATTTKEKEDEMNQKLNEELIAMR